MYVAICILVSYESAYMYYPLLSTLNVPVDMVLALCRLKICTRIDLIAVIFQTFLVKCP